ncbi:MAG: DUF916 domain-containing protein [Candidatus Saccharimonadales bacterium]
MLVAKRVQTSVRTIVAMILMVAVLIVLLADSRAFAATNTANTLKVSPVRTDIEILPGESKTVKTTVSNLTDAPITVSPIENDFVAGDERGTPALILDADKFAPTHSLKRFMTPLKNVTIPAGQSKVVEVVITVPANAQPGGYFGAVRFAPTSPDGGGQVNLSASVASLILMTVPGPAVEKLALTDFNIQQNGVTGTNFRTPNNLQATARFENKGSVQLGPFGKVSVKKGDKVVYDSDFNNKDPRDMILPDSARRWDIPLKNIDSFGNYTVSAVFTYGTKNQTIEVTKSFWVIPTAVIMWSIIGLITLIGLIVGIWLFLRGYKRRILQGTAAAPTRPSVAPAAPVAVPSSENDTVTRPPVRRL